MVNFTLTSGEPWWQGQIVFVISKILLIFLIRFEPEKNLMAFRNGLGFAMQYQRLGSKSTTYKAVNFAENTFVIFPAPSNLSEWLTRCFWSKRWLQVIQQATSKRSPWSPPLLAASTLQIKNPRKQSLLKTLLYIIIILNTQILARW